MRQPAFWSLVLTDISDPDFTHVSLAVLPAHATADPAAWARRLLSTAALPAWLAATLSLRNLVARRSLRCDTFSVCHVEGEEALVALDGRRFDVRIGVGVDKESALVRVVTALRYKDTAAHLLSLPLRVALPFLLSGMIARTRRGLSGVTR